MDYEPKRARDYRRMLGENGEYFKLGSLGGDTETEEHVRARERREAIRELDREVREQNRAAAERASRAAGKKPEKPEKEVLRKGFRHHAGDVDPRKLGRQPSKREQMILYAKQNVPKPVPAPPRRAPPKPLRSYGHWEEPVPEKFAEGPEWPHAWGGPPDVRGPHESKLGANARSSKRGMRLQPDETHDRGAKREMTELEKLEMEHRVHQQKLKELSLA